MPDKLFRGDITNSVVELNLLDEESSGGGVGTLSYRLGNTNNGEILTVSKGDFPDYTFGSNPYYGNANFKGLVIGTSCTSIGSFAFYYCDGLVGSLVIPDSVTSIGSNAFGGCISVTALYTNADTASWIGINALLATNALATIYVGPDVVGTYTPTFQGGSGMTVTTWDNYPDPIPN